MGAADACEATQLIDATGALSASSVDALLARSGITGDTPYKVVSIMGPQSSGKSTLLNTLFGTGFAEMVRYHRVAPTPGAALASLVARPGCRRRALSAPSSPWRTRPRRGR